MDFISVIDKITSKYSKTNEGLYSEEKCEVWQN